MKRIFLLLILATTVFSCKKEEEAITTDEVRDKLITNLNILHDAAGVYIDEFTTSGDTLSAFNALRAWLLEQESVSDGDYNSIEAIAVEFSNGLRSSITITPVGADGEHLRRGGESSSRLTEFQFETTDLKAIKNKDVLVMVPYPEEFDYSSEDLLNLELIIESARPDMKADIERGADVTLSDLNKLGDYGFIILDVHGVNYGFMLVYLDEEFSITDIWTPEEIIDEAFDVHSIPTDKIANGQIEIGLQILTKPDGSVNFRYHVLITEEYIRQLNVDLSDAALFGNHCFSGQTAEGPTVNNLPEAWRSLGLATYYGYAFDDQSSFPVDNGFCRDMEELLINGLVADGDSTGAAHLNPDGSSPFYYSASGYDPTRGKILTPVEEAPPAGEALYLVQFYDQNYQYDACEMETFTDSRDGQVYKAVTIGEQTWMAENLKYLPLVHTNSEFADAHDSETPAFGVYGYNGTSVGEAKANPNYDLFGVLYNWWAAMDGQSASASNPSGVQGICPSGWHLPSQDEWQELALFTGLISEAGEKLKSQAYWNAPSFSTDEFCFSAVPGGGRGDAFGDYRDISLTGFLWTTTEHEITPGVVYHAGFSYNADSWQSGGQSPGYGNACRCVKD